MSKSSSGRSGRDRLLPHARARGDDACMRQLLLIVAASLLASPFCRAADAPSADTAAKQLKDSPRHGEWVDITMPGSEVKLHTWVVYPETKDKAPVVIVIHEI